MVAITLLYRYADFVALLGGDEFVLGWIVGVGMIGSLAMRFAQGAAIDHIGHRQIWLGSLVLFIVSVLAHLALTSCETMWIYLLRIAFSTSVAGVFGASITSVSRRASLAQMAEVVGTLGTSGFLAMAIGPAVGDLLFPRGAITRQHCRSMFLVAAGCGLFAFCCAWIATRGEPVPRRRRRPPILWLLKRYHPGTVLLVGAATGLGVSLPATFLPVFAADRGIEHIAWFFGVYALTAFTTRMLTRRFPARFGIPPMIYLGLATLIFSLLAYLPVQSAAQLAMPGFLAGMAHAFLFPAVIAGGSAGFPTRHRGLGTTMVLASLDIGTLLGTPLAGGLLRGAAWAGWPPFTTMFLVNALLMTGVGIAFAGFSAQVRQSGAAVSGR